MSTTINEDTEITVSIREILAAIFFVITITSIIVRYETQIESIGDDISTLTSQNKVLHDKIQHMQELQFEQIRQKQDIEHIKQQLGVNIQCQTK